MTLDFATVLSVLAVAISVFGFSRTLPARVLSRLKEVEAATESAENRCRKLEDGEAARAAAQARFLDEAEDLLETNERIRRRVAARESREARTRQETPEETPQDGEVTDQWDPRHVALRKLAGL